MTLVDHNPHGIDTPEAYPGANQYPLQPIGQDEAAELQTPPQAFEPSLERAVTNRFANALGRLVGEHEKAAEDTIALGPAKPGDYAGGTNTVAPANDRYTSVHGVVVRNVKPYRPAAAHPGLPDGVLDAKSTAGLPEADAIIGETLETERLAEAFHFDLEGHELIDPTDERGYVSDIQEVNPISAEGDILPCKLYEVKVHDQFIAADPVGYQKVTEYVERLERVLEDRGFDVRNPRTEASKPEDWNEYTKAWASDPAVQGLAWWRKLVPTARALRYLTHKQENIVSDTGEQLPITPEAQAHFRFVHDAIGVRERAVAITHLLRQHFANLGSERLQFLSVASGTAEPVIEATVEATAGTGQVVDLTVADMDQKSLDMVRGNAERHNFPGNVTPVRMNVVAPNTPQKIAERTGVTQFDVVEDTGFREYFPQEGDELAAFKGKGLPQASELARMQWTMVKEGGIMLSGNMVLPRTQSGFVFGVVDWPLINARTERNIMTIYKEAGILDDPQAQVEMYRVIDDQTGVHLYNILKVAKLPAASVS